MSGQVQAPGPPSARPPARHAGAASSCTRQERGGPGWGRVTPDPMSTRLQPGAQGGPARLPVCREPREKGEVGPSPVAPLGHPLPLTQSPRVPVPPASPSLHDPGSAGPRPTPARPVPERQLGTVHSTCRQGHSQQTAPRTAALDAEKWPRHTRLTRAETNSASLGQGQRWSHAQTLGPGHTRPPWLTLSSCWGVPWVSSASVSSSDGGLRPRVSGTGLRRDCGHEREEAGKGGDLTSGLPRTPQGLTRLFPSGPHHSLRSRIP